MIFHFSSISGFLRRPEPSSNCSSSAVRGTAFCECTHHCTVARVLKLILIVYEYANLQRRCGAIGYRVDIRVDFIKFEYHGKFIKIDLNRVVPVPVLYETVKYIWCLLIVFRSTTPKNQQRSAGHRRSRKMPGTERRTPLVRAAELPAAQAAQRTARRRTGVCTTTATTTSNMII